MYKIRFGGDSLENERLTSNVISTIRLPLAVMVVFIHSFGDPITTESWAMDYSNLTSEQIYDLIRIAISHVLTHCAVPVFFLISGYLFFTKLQEWNLSVWKQKMHKRIYTILIPYIIWVSISIFQTPFKMVLGCIIKGKSWERITEWFFTLDWIHVYWNSYKWNLNQTNILGWITPSSSPHLVPFWFMRDLLVVVILTPLIYWCIKHLRGWFLALLAASYVTGIAIPLPGFSSMALLFFSIGAYITINRQDLVQTILRYKLIGYVITLLLFPIMVYLDGHNSAIGGRIYPFFIIAMVSTTINLTTTMVSKGRGSHLATLSNTTFFIFSAHIFLLPYAGILVHKMRNFIGISSVPITYFLIPLTTVLMCIITCRIIQTCTPRLAQMLGCR